MEVLSQAQVLLENTCPKCGENIATETVLVQGWEDQGISLTGKQTWLVRTVEVPGYCSPCSRKLFHLRLAATVLLFFPLWICAFSTTAWNAKSLVFVGILYFFYLIKHISYSWADWLLFGMELEMNLAGRVSAVRVNDSSVKFPVGCLPTLGRVAFLFCSVFFFAFLGGMVHDFGGVFKEQFSPQPEKKAVAPRGARTVEEALLSGDVEFVRKALDESPELLTAKGTRGDTILHGASEGGHPELVKFLVKKGAEIDATDKQPGNTPLHIAAIYGKSKAASVLIAAGAKIEISRTADGTTPIQAAVLFDKPEVLKVLLEAGADSNRKNASGFSLMELALKNKSNKVIPILKRLKKEK